MANILILSLVWSCYILIHCYEQLLLELFNTWSKCRGAAEIRLGRLSVQLEECKPCVIGPILTCSATVERRNPNMEVDMMGSKELVEWKRVAAWRKMLGVAGRQTWMGVFNLINHRSTCRGLGDRRGGKAGKQIRSRGPIGRSNRWA